MARLVTALTRLLNVQSPIIVPPMALVGNGTLAANAHLGGGFGFIPAGYKSREWLQSEIDIARKLLPHSSKLPIGVGYFGWELDKSASNDTITLPLTNNVQALWFSFGNDLEKYVKFVREHSEGKGTVVFVLVSTIEEGKAVIQDWKYKPDVLVCQGNESGGHGHSASPPLSVLLPTIISLLPPSSPIIPIAAGGITTSAHIASVLTLGAQAAVLGTRFLLTPEVTPSYPQHFQSLLLNSTSANTVRTTAYDRARGTTEWPMGVDGRGIINDTVRDFDAGVPEEVLVTKYKEAMGTKDANRVVVWAGTGIGLIKDIKPTKDIVSELTEGCIQQLKVAAKMLDGQQNE